MSKKLDFYLAEVQRDLEAVISTYESYQKKPTTDKLKGMLRMSFYAGYYAGKKEMQNNYAMKG